jgi:hypothetical protein
LEYADIEILARNGCRYVQLSHKEAGRLAVVAQADDQLFSDLDIGA